MGAACQQASGAEGRAVDAHVTADPLVDGHGGGDAAVVAAGGDPAPVGRGGDDVGRHRLAALVRDRGGSHGRLPSVAVREVEHLGAAGGLVGQSSANGTRRSGGRVDHSAIPCFVIIPLMHVTSPVVPGRSRNTSTILAERLEIVVVERPARERHTAGDGERSIGDEPELGSACTCTAAGKQL